MMSMSMASRCLALVSVLTALDFGLATSVERKKKHHHHHHHPGRVKRKHEKRNASETVHTNALQAKVSVSVNASAFANISNASEQLHGFSAAALPKSSHFGAAIHAAAHAALHRKHAAHHAAQVVTRWSDHDKTKGAPAVHFAAWGNGSAGIQQREANRSHGASLAVTASHVNGSWHRHDSEKAHPVVKVAKAAEVAATESAELLVNSPLPPDFEERFVRSVAKATGSVADAVHMLSVAPDPSEGPNINKVVFSAPRNVAHEVEDQAGDANSKLATGPMRVFLTDDSDQGSDDVADEAPARSHEAVHLQAEDPDEPDKEAEKSPAAPKGNTFDFDGEMPYGDLEPFGREDTAQELTDSSIGESDRMVDQIEVAEVAEEKRAVFRALTRLRGAAITSFDGIARSQTGNIDEYNMRNKWRETHPLHHLADEEADVNKWAFPNDADC